MSVAAFKMTLDDLIKSNKKSPPQGRGRGFGLDPARRFPNRTANRAAPCVMAKAPKSAWGHDMFAGGGRASDIETRTKLYLSNLDYGISDEDIKRPEIVEWVNQGGGEMVADQNEKNVHFVVECNGLVPCQTDIMSTYVSGHWVHSCLEEWQLQRV